MKTILRLIGLCLLMLVVSNLWFATCASGGRTVEEAPHIEADIEVFPQLGHSHSISSAVFSLDGKQVLSGSNDNTIKLWDVETGREIRTFTGHTYEVNSVVFSPDGKQILSGSSDNTVKLWDIFSGKEIKTFSGHRGIVASVTFSPDGKQILFNQNTTIKLWDMVTEKEIGTFSGHTLPVTSVSFSPDGKQFTSGSMDGTIKLWDINTNQEIRIFSGYINTGNFAYFDHDGKQVLSNAGKDIKLWDITTGRESRTFSGHTRAVTSFCISPDGKQILSGSNDYTIKLWDVATGQEIRTFSSHREVDTVSFSPDGKQVITGSKMDKTVKLWDVTTGREIRSFSVGNRTLLNSDPNMSFSFDGKLALTGSGLGETDVKLWDITTGQEIRAFTGHTSQVLSVVFSSDATQVVTGSMEIKIWDIATGQEIQTFSRDTIGNWIYSISFSPDGKQILFGSGDHLIRLWDVVTGQEIRTFSGHIGIVNSVYFSSDGKHILSGSSDGTVRLWDVATGKEIAAFISFSGADPQLASASRGLTVETETAATSNEGEWLSITPDGYYQASPRGDRYLNVRVNNSVFGIDSFRSVFYNPDVVQARLQGLPDPPSANITIQQAAAFIPPTVTIQSPANFSATSTATANLSVAITDQNQPVRNIKILVNGRLVGKDELSAIKGARGLQPQRASLTVTGNKKTVSFDLPLALDPGDNRIEVVAFNGYSENRRHVDITWNAPAGQRPPPSNLWILAVGVNDYNDSSVRNLSFCVADAKGVVNSLNAQEGRRYAKVNALLIADGEALAPTAAAIRRNLRFLDQAGERDIILLFLAGHGVSNGKGFFFLPADTRLNRDGTVNESSAISDRDIVSALDRAGNLLVFIDSCYSGGVDSDRMTRALMESNAFVFTSSRGNERSMEMPRLGHGAFTYSILEGLKGATAARARGNITVVSLSGFVSHDVPRITGGAQNPKAYSLGFYDFPMAFIE